MALYELWTELFDEFLNIPNCKELPDWADVNRRMMRELKNAVMEMRLEWKKALERFNAYMKQQMAIIN